MNFPQASLMLSLSYRCLNLAARVNLQTFKMKMVKLEKGHTVARQGPGQFRCDVWKVFQGLNQETHEPILIWLEICRSCPVWGKKWDFGVLECLGCCVFVLRLATKLLSWFK